ncbi:MAG: hypothetical protein C6W56_15185 [Caldibacillus debilis]|nr:MAG: hypothetical protein C6W56_15185 [Caldibacillus debilis]
MLDGLHRAAQDAGTVPFAAASALFGEEFSANFAILRLAAPGSAICCRFIPGFYGNQKFI